MCRMDGSRSVEAKGAGGQEKLNEGPVKLVNRFNFQEYKGRIRQLNRDMLGNTDRKVGTLERKRALERIHARMLTAGNSDMLLVSEKEDGTLEGCMYIEREARGKVATLKEAWAGMSRESQGPVFAELVLSAKERLLKDRYERLNMGETNNAYIKHATGDPNKFRFLHTVKSPDVLDHALPAVETPGIAEGGIPGREPEQPNSGVTESIG